MHTVILTLYIILSSQFTHPKLVLNYINNKVLALSLKKFDYNRHVETRLIWLDMSDHNINIFYMLILIDRCNTRVKIYKRRLKKNGLLSFMLLKSIK